MCFFVVELRKHVVTSLFTRCVVYHHGHLLPPVDVGYEVVLLLIQANLILLRIGEHYSANVSSGHPKNCSFSSHETCSQRRASWKNVFHVEDAITVQHRSVFQDCIIYVFDTLFLYRRIPEPSTHNLDASRQKCFRPP